jgi:proteasome lid subunit RPN8/RPN11
MSHRRFDGLLRELASRGEGRRESGAFLLGRAIGRPRELNEVIKIAFYDDLDPGSLTGGITFNAVGYSALGIICREHQLRVIADIHTHPGGWVEQSDTDSSHPMTALPGHVAFIDPNFARGPICPEHLGAHRFDGTHWASHFGTSVADLFDVYSSNPFRRPIAALANLLRKGSHPEGSRP